MEFGARLSRPSPASLPVTERSRLTARVILYGGLAVFVLAFLVFESHFYSHSEPCRHRLVALRNRAHSPSTTRILSLRGCRLSALPDGLTELTHLQRLDLSDNSFTDDAALDGLAVMAELDILFLTNNALARVPDVVAKLPRLRMLSLRDNRIQGPVALTWPKTLEWLILTGNSITRLMAAPVAVRKLMLSNNALTSFPDNLRQLTALELLRVSNNRIPRAALAEPTRVLPALRWYSCADNPGPQDSEAPTQNLLLTDASALRTHSVLGEGSSGVVYSATLNGRTRVALKEFRSPLSSDGRVMNEVRRSLPLSFVGFSIPAACRSTWPPLWATPTRICSSALLAGAPLPMASRSALPTSWCPRMRNLRHWRGRPASRRARWTCILPRRDSFFPFLLCC